MSTVQCFFSKSQLSFISTVLSRRLTVLKSGLSRCGVQEMPSFQSQIDSITSILSIIDSSVL